MTQAAVLAQMGNTNQTFRNRIINGAMQIAQRATSATVTAGTTVPTASTGYPAVDRWFVYSTGANVTAAQVAGTGATRNNLQVTGAASVTAVGIGQRIEALNSYDLAGQACTLSFNMSNSLLTTVTWTASYANTADTFGTIGTPTKTQIATGTITVSSTLTNFQINISVPAAATTGIEILFTVGAQTSGTWVVGNVQFEPGTNATPFEFRSYGTELALCQRYYWASPITSASQAIESCATTVGAPLTQPLAFIPPMRINNPTVSSPTVSATLGNNTTGVTLGYNGNPSVLICNGTYTSANPSRAYVTFNTGNYTASAEL